MVCIQIDSPTEVSFPYHIAILWRKANQRKYGSKQQKHISTHIILKKIIRKFEERSTTQKQKARFDGHVFIAAASPPATQWSPTYNTELLRCLGQHSRRWTDQGLCPSKFSCIYNKLTSSACNLPHKCLVIKNKERFFCREL